jgi:hypothetical protein
MIDILPFVSVSRTVALEPFVSPCTEYSFVVSVFFWPSIDMILPFRG